MGVSKIKIDNLSTNFLADMTPGKGPMNYLNLPTDTPAFKIHMNNDFILTVANSYLTIPFDDIVYNNGGGSWSGSPNYYYTVPRDGFYLVAVHVWMFDFPAGAWGTLRVSKGNRSAVAHEWIYCCDFNIASVYKLTTGVQVKAWARTTILNGATGPVVYRKPYNCMSIIFLGNTT